MSSTLWLVSGSIINSYLTYLTCPQSQVVCAIFCNNINFFSPVEMFVFIFYFILMRIEDFIESENRFQIISGLIPQIFSIKGWECGNRLDFINCCWMCIFFFLNYHLDSRFSYFFNFVLRCVPVFPIAQFVP